MSSFRSLYKVFNISQFFSACSKKKHYCRLQSLLSTIFYIQHIVSGGSLKSKYFFILRFWFAEYINQIFYNQITTMNQNHDQTCCRVVSETDFNVTQTRVGIFII